MTDAVEDQLQRLLPFKVVLRSEYTWDIYDWLLKKCGNPVERKYYSYDCVVIVEGSFNNKWALIESPGTFGFKEASNAVEFKLRFG